ncbi:MAG: patatin-like phospholipase family protein, partial [Chloroflexota bacterium]
MRIGLALSGGAARGLAHVGVLEALIKSGIPIDCVAGCSAGSILGALYCAGMPIERIRSFAPYISWRRIAEVARSDQGLLTFEKLERLMVMLIGDLEFQELNLPFAVVAMNAVNGERLIIRQGRVATAVRASCSIPGLVTPVEFGGRLLVDGGIVDNLPVDAARALEADFVIGVDVFEPHYRRDRGPLGKGLTAFETLVRNTGGGVGRADFLIAPRTAGRTYIRFSRYEELVQLGRQAAHERLPLLLKA